jgi:cytochrome c oxidase cbb3-type subunit I/II
MKDPESTSPGSIMPAYPWLYEATLEDRHTEGKIITLRRLGVPYPDAYEQPLLREMGRPQVSQVRLDMQAQAARIAANLAQAGMTIAPDREIVALIAYLQRLGTDIKAQPAAEAAPAAPAAPGPKGGR